MAQPTTLFQDGINFIQVRIIAHQSKGKSPKRRGIKGKFINLVKSFISINSYVSKSSVIDFNAWDTKVPRH